MTTTELPGVGARDWQGRRIMMLVLPEPQSVGSVRHTVRAVLRFWKLTRLSDVAELLTSELVTNAIQYAGDEQWIKVTVWQDQQSLSIDVRDRSTVVPQSRRATTDQENGRGLLLVEHLSDSWDCRVHPDGTKTVSCRLKL
ncbi:ATP-binding protein [Kitasatospora sp. RB6PN24]|uniref:ATP-binding protein n=1 Tax=Kitasatospora humi TaxID=2893891 RepID=UPI001E599ABF|nr:ATP-binding protein [Kitasatospora humi]MCC9312398.1 ATP-binding protein [Kitasatospora humi]